MNNRAIRVGDWKLVAKGDNGPWELYDLKTDRCEQKNLAEQNTRIAHATCRLSGRNTKTSSDARRDRLRRSRAKARSRKPSRRNVRSREMKYGEWSWS